MDFQFCFGKRGRVELSIGSSFGYVGIVLEWFPFDRERRTYFVEWNPYVTTRMSIHRSADLDYAVYHLANFIGYGCAATTEGTVAFRYCWIDFPHCLFPLPFAIPIGRWLIRWCRGERWAIKGECVMCGCYLREEPGMCPGCHDILMEGIIQKVVADLATNMNRDEGGVVVGKPGFGPESTSSMTTGSVGGSQ